MIIGGLQKFSLLDYPEKISAIVFTKGCNFRCPFCYNPMLVCQKDAVDELENKPYFAREEKSSEEIREVRDSQNISEADLFDFLKVRIGKLDAVVISGGEPTLHKDLPAFIKKIRNLGFLVKLDTNGTNPEMLEKLIKDGLLDYIAMDLKSSPRRYAKATAVKPDLSKIKKSIKIIMEAGLPYEFRTTVVPGLVDIEDIDSMADMIDGADKWFLQQFNSKVDLIDPELKGVTPHSQEVLQEMQKLGSTMVRECKIR